MPVNVNNKMPAPKTNAPPAQQPKANTAPTAPVPGMKKDAAGPNKGQKGFK